MRGSCACDGAALLLPSKVPPQMKRVPEPDLPLPRASLPEGCSDLAEAYQLRSAKEDAYEQLLLRLAALLHDPFVAQVDPEALLPGNEELLLKCISDFLHPILLSRPQVLKLIESSSDLVEALHEVVRANVESSE